MLFVLLLFYQFVKRRAKNISRLSTTPYLYGLEINRKGYILLLIAAISIFFFLVFNVFGSFDVSYVYKFNQIFYAQSKVGTAWIFFFLQAFVFVALYDIYLNGYSKFKIFCVLALILINAATGSRGNVVTYLLLFILIYGVIWRGKNVVFMGGVIFIIISSTLLYNTFYRSGADSLSKYLESSSSTADLNQVYAIADSIDYWNKNGACYTCLLEDISNFFIPRYFFPDKPI